MQKELSLKSRSREYTDHDRRKLRERYLELEHAIEAGIFRVDADEGRRLVNHRGSQDCSGLVIPYTLPWKSSDPREYRLRLDHPILEPRTDGKDGYKEKRKYLITSGARNRIYFPPKLTNEHLQDTSIALVIQEGEFKTLALWRIAREHSTDGKPLFISLGTSGAWNFQGVIGKAENERGERCDVHGFIPDLDFPAWSGRTVILLRDSNVHSNASIQAASGRLAFELKCRGAIERFADTPELPGVNGADDLAFRQGPESVLSLIFPDEEKQQLDSHSDYEPISKDPQREGYLWRLAGNASKVLRAVRLILQKLGLSDEKHARLIKNLLEANGYNRGPLRMTQAILAEKYGVSTSTVKRDIKQFLLDQAASEVDLLGYTPGSYNPTTSQGYPSVFRLYFLRYALQAIDKALNMNRSEYEYSWEALEAACDVVVAEIPRIAVVISDESSRASRQSEKLKSQKILEKLAAIQDEAINQMIAENWSDEDIGAAFRMIEEARSHYLGQARLASLENDHYLHVNGKEVVVKIENDHPVHVAHFDLHVPARQNACAEGARMKLSNPVNRI